MPNHFPTLAEQAALNPPSGDVVPIGMSAFDDAMHGGWRGGELIVVSGRTGEGKTTWCQNVTANMDQAGVGAVWFTFEMSPWYLQQKFALILPPLGPGMTRVPSALSVSNVNWVAEAIKAAHAEHGTKVFVIDHLHYLIPLMQYENTSLTVGHTVRVLKRMAEELGVIIVLIAHTKKVYQDEHLDLSSIRDSSLIAQEADYVFLVERIREKPEAAKRDPTVAPTLTNKARVMLAKNRRTGENITHEYFVKDGLFQPIY